MTDVIGTVNANIPEQKVALNQLEQQPLKPTTTEQQDLTTEGQRKINLIWEATQSAISLVVVFANMIVATWDGLTPTCGLISGKCHSEFPTILSSALFLIIGFYFSRTNHQAIGGIGAKPTEAYIGR
jgi:hypothetical protein